MRRGIGGLAERAEKLRRLHTGPRPLVLPNAWDVASARLVAEAGFPVVATSSGAVAATLGYEDDDSMPVDEAFGVIARIARSVPVPVTADVEAGYGLSPEDLVASLLDTGAVGCNVEDTDHHGGGGLVDAGENAERLRAVRHEATEAGVELVLNARIDVLRCAGDRRELFEEAVRRARLYLQAGADCVFPIRLGDDELIGEFVRRVEGPVNVVAAGAPPLARLAALGVARVSFAGSLTEQLLAREKEHTRLGDEIARQRRELPRVPVEKDYRFDTDDGEKALIELFDGRSQLLVYHFMFGPSYQAGCPVNSSIADTVDGVLPHLHARDITFLLVSQAPLEKLHAYKRRMGWRLPWVSTAHTDFNFDLGFSHTEEQAREAVAQMTPTGLDFRSASTEARRATRPGTETGLPPIVEHNARSTGTDAVGYLTESPGFSTFVHDEGAVYHAYSTTWRGLEFLMGYYPILDHAPKGRDEGEAWQLWIRRHDEYGSRLVGS